MLVFRQKDTAERANTQHLRLRINVIVLFKLMDTLLFVAKSGLDDLFLHALGILSVFSATFGSRVHAAHFILLPFQILLNEISL